MSSEESFKSKLISIIDDYDNIELSMSELIKEIIKMKDLEVKKALEETWTFVSHETPPINTELLAKSPEGNFHLCGWRESYNIFTCQEKSESSYEWKWKLL